MPEEPEIYVSCKVHPSLFKPRGFPIFHKHEYTPPSVEAEILDQIDRSTKLLRKLLKKAQYSSELKNRLDEFVTSRQTFLTKLGEVPEVEMFKNRVLFLESEVEKEIEILEMEKELEEILTGEKVIEKLIEVEEEVEAEEELAIVSEKEYNNLLDAVADAINQEKENGRSGIEGIIAEYCAHHLKLLDWLVEQSLRIEELKIGQSEFHQLLANLIMLDTLLIANKKDDLETKRSILVPLDFSPLRIQLVTLSENVNWNRLSYPPLLLLWKDGISQLVKPYRTLDGHPMMLYVPEFRRVAERSQEEIRRALDNFRESVEPLIRNVKGLTPMGRRGTVPTLIREPLAKIVSLYLDYNPMSVDNLRIMDLGCGSGALLKDIYRKLMDTEELGSQIFIHTLLNDVMENLGRTIMKESQKEQFLGKLEFHVWAGDMRGMIERAHEEAISFDIAFINRVFDLYGGYGVFRFNVEAKFTAKVQTTVKLSEMTSLDYPEKLTAFSGALAHGKIWRAIKYLLGQRIETRSGVAFLPAIEMNMLKNFFAWKGKKGLELFLKLLSVATLVVISVFPGSFETLFPNINSANEIYHFPIGKYPSSYSIICVSKDKQLIDFLKKRKSK